MTMPQRRAHKIRLNPTPEQEEYFRKAAGTARFAYNWGLAQIKQALKAMPGRLMRQPAGSESNVTYSPSCFIVGGRKLFIYGGEIHYFRIPPDQWVRRLWLAKQAGLNTVSTYIPWNFYESEEGEFQAWEGQRDLRRFLALCREVGLYAILRPGPFIHAEWRYGGLPDWVIDKGITVLNRGNQHHYLEWVRKWYSFVFDEVREHLFTRGGPVILVQVENEYGTDWGGKYGGIDHLYRLRDMLRASGVDVPLIGMNDVKESLYSDDFVPIGGAYPLNSWTADGKFRPLPLHSAHPKDVY